MLIFSLVALVDTHKMDKEITQTLFQYKMEWMLETIGEAQQMVTWQFHFPCSSLQKADVEIEIRIHDSPEKRYYPILHPVV